MFSSLHVLGDARTSVVHFRTNIHLFDFAPIGGCYTRTSGPLFRTNILPSFRAPIWDSQCHRFEFAPMLDPFDQKNEMGAEYLPLTINQGKIFLGSHVSTSGAVDHGNKAQSKRSYCFCERNRRECRRHHGETPRQRRRQSITWPLSRTTSSRRKRRRHFCKCTTRSRISNGKHLA